MQKLKTHLFFLLLCLFTMADTANASFHNCTTMSDCQDLDPYLYCHLGLGQCMPLKDSQDVCRFDYECIEGYTCKNNLCYRLSVGQIFWETILLIFCVSSFIFCIKDFLKWKKNRRSVAARLAPQTTPLVERATQNTTVSEATPV